MTSVEAYLEELENRIDPAVEDRLLAEWEAFTEGRFEGDIFSPKRVNQVEAGIEWPQVSVNLAQNDLDAMVLQQYGACFDQLASGVGSLMTVRANYGTAIMPSLFGAELFVMDEELNSVQTSKPLGAGAMEDLAEKGGPDMRAGLGASVLDAGQRFVQISAEYPKIGKYIHMYHPDIQGPMDLCEMLWGSEMFVDLIRPYDQRLLDELGGGAVHFCGRGSHYIASTCGMDWIHAIQLSQPHLNEMETIYRNTVDKGIKLLGFSSEHAQEALAAGRRLHGCVHCH